MNLMEAIIAAKLGGGGGGGSVTPASIVTATGQMTAQQAADTLDNVGAEPKKLAVNLTESNGVITADKTYEEIVEAIQDKRTVVCSYGDMEYQYVDYAGGDLTFSCLTTDGCNGATLRQLYLIGDDWTYSECNVQPNMVNVTYAELVLKRSRGALIPGMQYRITDYITVINGSYDLSAIGAQGYIHYAVSAGHPFDIIVVADGVRHLSENARAAARYGDNYFANSDVAAWRLKYTLDNDPTRFTWADETNGKGVVFWMEDEFNNRAGYDFKNIQFVRYALKLADITASFTPTDTGLVYDADNQPNRYGSMYQIFMALQAYMQSGTYVNPFKDANDNANYDFAVGANILGTIQMASIDASYKAAFNADCYYTFDYFDGSAHTDASLNGLAKLPCRENYIELETDPLSAALMDTYNVYGLGGSVWETNRVYIDGLSDGVWAACSGNHLSLHNWCNTFGNSCHSNTFGNNCHSNTFGNNCYSNTFGNNCHSNTFGNNCYSNTFGNSCNSNTFGNNCYSNTFGNSCNSNTFGNNCYSNTFGDFCHSNTFGNFCYSNTFGNYCYSNTFGNNCYSNTFGNNCHSNTFGNNCYSNTFGNNCHSNKFATASGGTTPQNYFKNITLGDGCANLTLYNSATSTSYVQNYHVLNGFNGRAVEVQRGLTACNFIGFNSSGVVKIYNIMDNAT